jgi:hypothetical protein
MIIKHMIINLGPMLDRNKLILDKREFLKFKETMERAGFAHQERRGLSGSIYASGPLTGGELRKYTGGNELTVCFDFNTQNISVSAYFRTADYSNTSFIAMAFPGKEHESYGTDYSGVIRLTPLPEEATGRDVGPYRGAASAGKLPLADRIMEAGSALCLAADEFGRIISSQDIKARHAEIALEYVVSMAEEIPHPNQHIKTVEDGTEELRRMLENEGKGALEKILGKIKDNQVIAHAMNYIADKTSGQLPL